RGRQERRHAFIPALFLGGSLQRIVLETLVLLQPAAGLDDLERVGRRHQHLGQQRVRVKRDRREERIDLSGLEQLVLRRSARRGWSRLALRARHRGKNNKQNECQ